MSSAAFAPARRVGFTGQWTWIWVAGAVVLALALRIPFIGEPAYPDEGGYLLVAEQWHRGGSALYGNLFVDRPPLLMVFWRLAADLGGVEAARWLACLPVAVLVICAGWAGRLAGGRRGAIWSSLTAAALASTPALGAHEVDGELLAVPLVMASCTFTLMALRRTSWSAQARWAASAGLTGACAVLVKQNFVDALVFAVVLVVASALTGSLSRRSAVRVLGWGFAGASVAAAATVAWATTTAPGVSGLGYVMYGFRSDAGQVIVDHSLTAPLSRLSTLTDSALVSGIVVVIVLYLSTSWTRLRRRDPLTVATITMVVVGVAGVALGASYWAHYLVGLIPVVALAAASFGWRASIMRRLVVAAVSFVVASAVVMSVARVGATYPSRVTDVALEGMLSEAAYPSDTVVITYGHANVIEASGLSPGYAYLWSLPMRTLDPHLRLLTETLSGPRAPAWVVEWDSLNSWEIDASGRLAATVSQHYREVSTVCGATVFLHDGLTRSLSGAPDPCAG